MKVVLLLAIISSTFIPNLLPGLKAKMLIDPEQPSTKKLYEELLEELNGAHLRVAASHLPPTMVIEKNPDGTFRYSGYITDACQYLSQVFKYTYSYVNVVEDEMKKGGPIWAESQLLLRNEADIICKDFQVILDLYNQFDIAVPIYTTGTAMVVPWPDEESRLLAPIHPFQPMVWLILCAVLLIMTFIFTFLPWIYQKMMANNMGNLFSFNIELSNQALAIAANVTGHGGSWPSIANKLFYRIVLGSWCLAMLVIVNAYSSLLISFLTIPTLKPVAKSFDDVTFRNVQGLAPLTFKNTLATNMMAVANQSSVLNKWQKRALIFSKYFQENPGNLYTTNQQRFDLMYSGKHSDAINELLAISYLNELNKKAGYCRFTVSNKHVDDLPDFHRAFWFRKNWRYTDAIRNKMQWWSDNGLVMHWIKNSQPSSKGCLFEDYKKNAPTIRVLTLRDYSGVFLVWLIGCSLSLFVFLMEKIHYYRMMNRRLVVLSVLTYSVL